MSEDHWINSVYRMLVYMGVDPSTLSMNIATEDVDKNGKTATMMMGIESTQVGLSIEENVTSPFEEDGWYVTPATLASLISAHDAFKSIESFVTEHKRRSTMNATKQTSQHEQWLIDAIIRRGLPIPDRNHKLIKGDGKELTTPDMAWPNLKIAFFVDGLWWHQTRDDSEKVKEFLQEEGNDLFLLESNKTRAEKDSAIRSEMSMRGWRVLSCTDRDLESNEGIQKQVENVERMMDLVKHEQSRLMSIAENTSIDENDSLDIDEFLS